jgi:hypothetical protein
MEGASPKGAKWQALSIEVEENEEQGLHPQPPSGEDNWTKVYYTGL